jgi:hypothetical protein
MGGAACMNGNPSHELVRSWSNRTPAMNMPIAFGESLDHVLQLAHRWYADGCEGVRILVADKLELLQQFDVPQMQAAVALCFWGRSGSYLLASYLDGHEDIVMLPMITGEGIYPFFNEYQSLSVWEKLIAYPAFSEQRGAEGMFFTGDHAIAAADYYAAVDALFETYGDRPAAWLNERRRFFQFLHVAYAVAIGRRPGTSRPLMVYAQHWVNEERAACFVEDFPNAQFIHTIRDPISSFDSWFDRVLDMQMYGAGKRPELASQYLSPAIDTVKHLLTWDRAHRGMESRTRAVRFEDMHVAPEATMRRLAEWLGIGYRPSLLQSTWNGTPYVVEIRGVASCGPNPANALRRSKNLDAADRLTIFALMHENFIAWNYPSPKLLRRRWMRLCVIALFWLIPMRMELATARWVLERQALPALRNGRVGFALRAPLYVLERRLRMMWLIAAQALPRQLGKRRLLQPL